MMRTYTPLLIAAAITFGCITATAQGNLAISTSNIAISRASLPASTTDAPVRTPEQARRHYMAMFNLMRDFSVTVDTVTTSSIYNVRDEDLPKDQPQNGSFSNYVDKMTKLLTRRLESKPIPVAVSMNELREKARYQGAITLLKSAGCLDGKNEGKLVKTKDFDGNDIIAYPLDELRKNSRYGLVENYREGFARIRKDQVYGYLNLCGDEIITCQYQNAEPFNNGKALVKRIDWYFIDANGEEGDESLANVLEARALGYGINWVRLTNGKQALVDNNYDVSKVAISDMYDAIEPFYSSDVLKVRIGKKMGLIALNGKVKLEAIYDNIEPTAFPDIFKLALNGKLGLMDSTWTVKVPPTYTYLSDFNTFGLAVGQLEKGSVLIDKNSFATSRFYQSIGNFNDFGVAIVRDEFNHFGLIGAHMEIVAEPKYASIGEFNELGLAPACYTNEKCGFIRFDGVEQIKADYTSVGNFNAFGLAVASLKVKDCLGKKGAECDADVLIDREGNIVVPVFEESITRKLRLEITDTVHSENYIIMNVFENGNKSNINFMLIDKRSLKLITPVPYQAISPVDLHGIIRVKKDNRWAMMDTLGKVLTKYQYLDIRRMGEAYYAVQNGDSKWGFVNKKGKTQIPYEYDEVWQFRNGFAPASKGKEKWGLINRFNAKVVPCEFKSVKFINDKYEFTDREGNVYVVNEQGDCEKNCEKFEQIRANANKQ